MTKLSYISGALLGLTGVITGAMGAHALEGSLSPDQLDAYETAVRFQMYHSLLLLLLGALGSFFGERNSLRFAIVGVLIGTLLFSGSIYLLVLTPFKLGLVTPIGGSILILGWAGLVVWAFERQKDVHWPDWKQDQ